MPVRKPPSGPTPAEADRDDAQADIQARDDAVAPSEDATAVPAAPAADAADNSAAEEAVRAGAVEFEDNDRNAIASAIAKRRGKEPGEDEETDGEGDAPAAPIRPAATAAPAAAKPAPRKVRFDELEPDALVVVKINGRDVEVAASDLVGNGQKYLAGEDYLRQAKDLLESTRRSRSGDAPDDQNRDTRPTDRQNQPARREVSQSPAATPAKTKAERDAIIATAMDAVQTGTPEEAAKAFQDAFDLLNQAGGSGAVTQGDVTRLVGEALSDTEVRNGARSEINEAIVSLKTAHPELDKYPSLAPALLKGGYDLMLTSLREIGVPEEDLRQPANDVIAGYARLRQNPAWRDKLKPVREVYDAAATAIDAEFGFQGAPSRENRPAGNQPVRLSAVREARRTTIPQQPRPAAIRAEGGREEAPRRNNANTIAQMADQREQGVALRR